MCSFQTEISQTLYVEVKTMCHLIYIFKKNSCQMLFKGPQIQLKMNCSALVQ